MNPCNVEIPLPNARLKCNTLYHFRVSARGDGSPYSTAFGGASSGVSQSTSACRPAIAVSLKNPFLKQAVSLTATTTAESGPVASYQWQEWGAGGWANLGATTTYATRSVSTSTAGYITFRVVAAYTSTTTPAATSRPVTIRWRPMSVIASSTPAFPQSGPPATSTVTLVAAAVAPSDAAYRWQEWTGGAWTNLGSTTTRQTVASSVRGTRKFRIEVSHAVVPSATSAPVYVTWDEWAIVGDLVKELSAAVATSTRYKTAQVALLSCMNGPTGGGGKAGGTSTTPTYTSFDDILSWYATTTKAKTDGECSATSTAMFSTNASTTREELAKLKASSTEYAALLDTPHGRHFEANVGNADKLKLHAILMRGGGASGSDGAAGKDSGGTTGLNCLPPYGTEPSTLQGKLDVLNCLVFATPYRFWFDQAEMSVLLENLRSESYGWLDDGDWECTLVPWDAIPNRESCLRHDVAVHSLVRFAGTSNEFGDNDLAWNPRNRFLADEVFAIDLACGRQPRDDWRRCVRLGRSTLSWREAQFNVVWVFSRVVSGGFKWLSDKVFGVKVPVTDLDIAHARAIPRFLQCNIPSVNVIGVRSNNRGDFIGELTLSGSNSCTGETYSIDTITWRANYGNPPVDVYDNIEGFSEVSSSSWFTPPRSWIGWKQPLSSVEMRHAAIEPDNVVNFGGPYLGLAMDHTYTLPKGSSGGPID